jgi:hypothetical protein
MENLIIEGTNNTPFVNFKNNGELNMEGRSLPEDSVKFYTPLFDWTKQLSTEKVIFNVKLEYLNTASSKQLLSLLKIVTENPTIKDIEINWYYEEGDLDGLETGEHYATIIKAPFKFIEYAETDSF